MDLEHKHTAQNEPPAKQDPDSRAASDDRHDINGNPVIGHIIELRKRILIVFLLWIAGTALSFAFSKEIFAYLAKPLVEAFAGTPTGLAGRRLIFTGLAEGFLAQLRVALYTGAFIALPVLAWHIWRFIAPGLYWREKRHVLPLAVATPALFYAGMALVYFIIMPVAWGFFLNFETPGVNGLPVELEARIGEYVTLSLRLMIAFGIAFQLPILLSVLGSAGLITHYGLARFRKYAVILIFAASALLTPPDLISQIALALPLILLYETSIWVIRLSAGSDKKGRPDEGS